MNTFEMTTYGWSGECHIRHIPKEMFKFLERVEDQGQSVEDLLHELAETTGDVSDELDPRIKDWLQPPCFNNPWYWHEGDVLCGIRPINDVLRVEVNEKEIDLSDLPPFSPFPEREIKTLQNGYKADDMGETELTYYLPTIGFCAYEKGCQGTYTIETTDKEFDITKVSVDVLETSHSTFIERFYYDGELMESTGDPEGQGKSFEVNWGLLPISQSEEYSPEKWSYGEVA